VKGSIKLGIKYVHGMDPYVMFSFPANDPAAETLVLALANLPFVQNDDEVEVEPGEEAFICRWIYSDGYVPVERPSSDDDDVPF